MTRPLMLVVAGPPGSGKSTLYPVTALGIDAFNIDDRCAQLVGSYRAIPRAVRDGVAAECRAFIEAHLRERASFAVETTLRTDAAIRQAEAARAAGFLTEMRFVGTASSDVNVERIKQRAQSGGHAASESEIRVTYAASIGNLGEAIRVFERCTVMDATAAWRRPRRIATAHKGTIDLDGEPPAWAAAFLRNI